MLPDAALKTEQHYTFCFCLGKMELEIVEIMQRAYQNDSLSKQMILQWYRASKRDGSQDTTLCMEVAGLVISSTDALVNTIFTIIAKDGSLTFFGNNCRNSVTNMSGGGHHWVGSMWNEVS